jgi:hypothetical protein
MVLICLDKFHPYFSFI